MRLDPPVPRWPHGIGMTKNYTTLHDLPYFFDPDLLAKGLREGRFHRDVPARFGIMPRFGRTEDVGWFEAKPSWVMHLSNCYEDGNWVVQDGCLWTDLVKPPVSEQHDDVYARIKRNVDATATGAHMYRWMFNLRPARCASSPSMTR